MNDTVIGRYVLDTKFVNTNAGFSKWAFCHDTRDGRRCFIKEFLNPIYPTEDSPYDEATRQRMRTFCEQYERDRIQLYRAINEASCGSAVRIKAFFRARSKYYIVMRRVDAKDRSLEAGLNTLDARERETLCLVLCHALTRLHERGIVYADLKPSNLLLERASGGRANLRLIDFDACFFERLGTEELVGDQVYFAPEVVPFMQEGPEAVRLTQKMDVFSAGLLVHQLLTGKLPELPSGDAYAFEAALNHHAILPSAALPEAVRRLILQMLERDPAARCGMREAFERLKALFAETSDVPRPTSIHDTPRPAPEPRSDPPEPEPGAEDSEPSRIRLGPGFRASSRPGTEAKRPGAERPGFHHLGDL